MPDTIQAVLLELVAKRAEKSIDEISLGARLEDIGIDSLGMAELIFDIEDQFNITIHDSDDIQGRFDFGTLNDVAQRLEKQIALQEQKK